MPKAMWAALLIQNENVQHLDISSAASSHAKRNVIVSAHEFFVNASFLSFSLASGRLTEPADGLQGPFHKFAHPLENPGAYKGVLGWPVGVIVTGRA